MRHLKTRSYLIAFLAFIAILALTLSACQKKAEVKGKKEEVIKIGAILPLTGDFSLFGGWLKDGIEYAINESRLPIKVIYEDNMNKTASAVSAFKKLANIDKVKAIITARTPVANALTPLTLSSKVFTIFTFADLPKGDKTFILNYHFPVQDEAATLAEFAYKKLGKKSAIIVVNDDFGILGASCFKKRYTELGGEVLNMESFSPKEKNFRSLLLKFKKAKIDAIFVIAYEQNFLALAKTMKEMKLDVPIIGPNVLTVYLPLVKQYLPTSYFTMSLYDSGETVNEKYKIFVSNYKATTGKEPNMVIAEAYEATKILLEAIKQNSENLTEFFNNFTSYKGIFGTISIDDNRQAHFPLVVMSIEKGEKKQIVWRYLPARIQK